MRADVMSALLIFGKIVEAFVRLNKENPSTRNDEPKVDKKQERKE